MSVSRRRDIRNREGIVMSRLKELRKYVNAEINEMEDPDKRTSAFLWKLGRNGTKRKN